MTNVPLGDLVELRSGVGFPTHMQGRKAGSYPMVKVADISRTGRSSLDTLHASANWIDEEDLADLRMRPVPAGAVVFAKIGEAIRQNHRAIAGRSLLLDNNAMAAVPISGKIAPPYLFRYLQSVDFYRLATSTTVPSLRKSELAKLLVPLPDLQRQEHIVRVLDLADGIRKRRLQAEILHKRLLESVFVDLFQSAASKAVRLEDIATVSSGITKGRKVKSSTTDIAYLTVANVQAGYLNLNEVKKIAATEAEIERFSLRVGDIVLTEGGDPDKLGRGTVWRGEIAPCIHQNHIFRVRLRADSLVTPEYLSGFMASRAGRAYFLRSAKQTTGIASINSTQLKSMPVPVPSLALQRAYSAVTSSVLSSTLTVRRALAKDRELFTSLQYRAFRGEL